MPRAPKRTAELDEDVDRHAPRKRARKKRQSIRPPIYTATVEELAQSDSRVQVSALNDSERDILNRIQKCLARAKHPTACEREMKAAMYYVSRLQQQYNITQADIAAYEKAQEQSHSTGQSTVSIKHAYGCPRMVRNQGYAIGLCEAMTIFFGCKFYSVSTPRSVQYKFYGLSENTVVAAMMMKRSYNLTVNLASFQKGNKLSYCLGIAEGLKQTANKEKADELRKAKKAERIALKATVREERKQRQRELARLNYREDEDEAENVDEDAIRALDSDDDTASDHSEDEEDDNANDDVQTDFKNDEEAMFLDEDDEKWIKDFATRAGSSNSRSKEQSRRAAPPLSVSGNASKWSSTTQLMTYRNHLNTIADDYIRDNDIKIPKLRPRAGPRDLTAYSIGIRDSATIRNRLSGAK